MKHTHRGHCQICGRIQAAQAHAAPAHHTLPKHGYKVAGFGFFVGTCDGTNKRPLEEARDACDDVCEALGRYAVEQDALAAAYRDGSKLPVKVQTSERVRTVKGWEYVMAPYSEGTKLQQLDAVKAAINLHVREARHARGHAASMQQLADDRHGKPLLPAVRFQGVAIVKGLTFTHTKGIKAPRTLTVTGRQKGRWHLCADQNGREWTYSAVEIRKHLK